MIIRPETVLDSHRKRFKTGNRDFRTYHVPTDAEAKHGIVADVANLFGQITFAICCRSTSYRTDGKTARVVWIHCFLSSTNEEGLSHSRSQPWFADTGGTVRRNHRNLRDLNRQDRADKLIELMLKK